MHTVENLRSGRAKGAAVLALGTLLALTAASAPSRAANNAISVPAQAGHAWQPGSSTCFSNPGYSNGILNTCSSQQSWLVPMPLQGAINAPFMASYYAGAKAGGSSVHCRFVVRDYSDNNVYLGPDTYITGAFIPIGGTTVNASMDTQHLDCSFPAAPTNELTSFVMEY